MDHKPTNKAALLPWMVRDENDPYTAEEEALRLASAAALEVR